MNPATLIVTFSVTWWLVFFILLPIGVKVSDTHEPGHATSAPEKPLLVKKIVATTVITVVLTGGFFVLLEYGWLDFIRLRPE